MNLAAAAVTGLMTMLEDEEMGEDGKYEDEEKMGDGDE